MGKSDKLTPAQRAVLTYVKRHLKLRLSKYPADGRAIRALEKRGLLVFERNHAIGGYVLTASGRAAVEANHD